MEKLINHIQTNVLFSFLKSSPSSSKSKLNWFFLNSIVDLEKLLSESKNNYIAIFKHSTRCSISTMAKQKLERSWNLPEEAIKMYYLDLIAHRDISNYIAEKLRIEHQSPQILVLKNGKCIYNDSHNGISCQGVKNAIGL